jgi:ribosome-associated protein
MAGSGRNPTRSRSNEKKPVGGKNTGSARKIPAAAKVAAPAPAQKTDSPDAATLAQRAAAICLEYKANDVVMLDLRGVTDMTDFFIVASGTSDTHVRSVGEHVVDEMKKSGARAHHIEGLTQGRWVLLDFVDFVVHLFHPTLREFYQLERLWSDAVVIPIAAQGAGA